MFISQLFVYPIKSLGGIELQSAQLESRGLQYDRRWMLVDENNVFITQRSDAMLSMLQSELTPDALLVKHKNIDGEKISIPLLPENISRIKVQVWDDYCDAIPMESTINAWFSYHLNRRCKLVYMPGDSLRKVDQSYALKESDITSFSDAYPLLLIGQSSLDHLNNKLAQPLPINRFRPNIVFSGGLPYEEDQMSHFRINEIDFYGVKLCSRCVMTTIDQQTAKKGKEPLQTLAGYRSKNNKIYFGQNIIAHGSGTLTVGDEIEIVKRKEATFPLDN